MYLGVLRQVGAKLYRQWPTKSRLNVNSRCLAGETQSLWESKSTNPASKYSIEEYWDITMGCNSSKGTEVVDSSKKPGDRRKSVESDDSSDKEEDDRILGLRRKTADTVFKFAGYLPQASMFISSPVVIS
ncbi:hypothetical protein F2P79_008597 [Pimephales promelas]|nr:hypothetical protein F2P79_008597 [Pimephales promelas]